MSQVLINQYLAELDRLKKVGGTHRESVVREAFKDLLVPADAHLTGGDENRPLESRDRCGLWLDGQSRSAPRVTSAATSGRQKAIFSEPPPSHPGLVQQPVQIVASTI